MVFIYTLEDPTIEGIEGVGYVGKTVKPLEERRKGGYRAYCKHWLNSLEENGITPQCVEIDYVEDEDWVEAERLYIKEYRTLGCPLRNLTEGGEGTIGRPTTEETKAKISSSNKGKPAPNKGIPHTNETKRKIGDKHRGKPLAEETREKLSQVLSGRKQSPEWIEKRTSALKGRSPSSLCLSNASKVNTRMLTLGEETLRMSDWLNRLGIARNTFYARLDRGWSMEKALSVPNTKKEGKKK